MATKPQRARTTLQRSGGFAGLTLKSTVDSDDLDPQERDSYLELVDGLDLAELSTTRGTSVSSQADRFQYDLTVEVDGRPFTMRYGERELPAQLKPLTQLLLDRARKPR